jgi:hypothetical protein
MEVICDGNQEELVKTFIGNGHILRQDRKMSIVKFWVFHNIWEEFWKFTKFSEIS